MRTRRTIDRELLRSVLRGEGELGSRLAALRDLSSAVRTSEYHITNACNLRCKGCWFFEYEYDQRVADLSSTESWRLFAKQQAEDRGMSSALLIGGEPALYPERVAAFVEAMAYVTISSNGLRGLPVEGFENVAIALTLFGGEGADDELRAVRPSGIRFSGLFDSVLKNYCGDPRATFIFALSSDHLSAIEPAVRRIRDNGNIVSFNYYSHYGSDDPLRSESEVRLLEEALRVRELYQDTIINTPYSIRTVVSGQTDWANFSYDVCPSISGDHPAHEERLKNGNPVLPGFNSYASDGKSVNFCCASGACDGCRDSQAIFSWLLVSMREFLETPERLECWLDIAESYWRQFRWSPYHRTSVT